MGQRIDELKGLIAGVDLTDPFAAIDVVRWQKELAYLLKHGEPGEPTAQARRRAARQAVQQGSTASAAALPVAKPKATVPAVQPKVPVRPHQPAAVAKPMPLPPPMPREGSLFWGRMKWVKAARWCQEQLRELPAAPGVNQKRKSKQSRSLRYERGVQELFLGLIQTLLQAKTIAAYQTAQSQLVKFWSEHQRQLGSAPVPRPWPKVNASGGAPGGGQGSKAKKAPSLAATAGRGGVTAPGETFAAYNRLPMTGHGRSFEDSVALRQSGKRVIRALVDRIDRFSASGSSEEQDDFN